MLIDPPYELKSDYQAVVKGIQEGHRRFATGTYAVWYPVVLRQQIKRMVKDFRNRDPQDFANRAGGTP